MADRFEDPRVEGELRDLNAKLSRIEKNVQEAESAARKAEAGTRRTQSSPGRAERPLDEDFRATETARQRAAHEERTARAKERGAKAAETQDRFEARAVGRRSAEVFDRQTGERQGTRFQGNYPRGVPGQPPSPVAQANALAKATAYADQLNRASRAVDRISEGLIRHPQLFGRQVYTRTGPEFPGAQQPRPPGGVAAADQRLSQAQIGLKEAQAAERRAIASRSAANVTAARNTRVAAQQELAAATANVEATRAEVAARQQAVAQLSGLTAAERAAHEQQIVALRAQAASIERALISQARPALPPGRPVGLLPEVAQDARRREQEAIRAQSRQQTLRSFVGGNDPADQAARQAQSAPRAATATRSYGDALAFSAREQALAANQMRRHGALTSEFIEAAARGRTTIRELGYQVGATIGKFAGWTAAATAVFGAAAAIRELGTGAIDSAEGVNNLTRIIPRIDRDAAAQSISGLSRQFNVPIADVSDAAYGISKVFGSIRNPVEAANATFKATESVLFAMKVGELDVADATKYLTSIIQGFQLDANELPDLFDTINQAQNRFGGNVGQITQGVAQAAGAFSSAGGNYRDLIALIQTGARVTGRTGREIGTGLRRSAEIYQRPERRQTIIDLLGIDPRESTVTQVIERAMARVRGAAPALQAQIAKAISTPELASGRILPILRSGALYREIQSQLVPTKTAGSAERELTRALRGPREQIARLRNDMQQLGAELARAGFLAPFATLVKLLDRALLLVKGITTGIGGIRDLPGGDLFAGAAAYALPAAAGIGLARRFDAGGPGSLFGRGAGARTRGNLLSGLRAEEEAVASARVGHASEIRTSSNRVARLDGQIAALKAQEIGDAEADAGLIQRRGRLEAQRATAAQQQLDAEGDLNSLQRQHAQVIEQQRVVTRSRFRSEAEVLRRYQAAGGVYTQPVPHGAYPGGPTLIDPARGPQAPITPTGPFVDPTRGPQAPDQAIRRASEENTRLQQRAQRFSASAREMGTTGRLAGAAATRAAGAAAVAGSALSNAGGALSGGATRVGALVGPLDLIVLGLTAFVALEVLLSDKNREIADAARKLDRAAGPGELAQQIKATQENVDSTGTKIAGAFQEIENVGVGLSEVLRGDLRKGKGADRVLSGVDTPGEKGEAAIEEAKRRRRYILDQQRRGRLYYQGDIRSQLRREFEQAYAGPEGDDNRQRAIEDAQRDLRDSLAVKGRGRNRQGARTERAITRDLIAQMKGEAAATAQGVTAFRQALADVDSSASAEALVRGLELRISQRGVRPTLGRTSQAIARLRQLAASTKNTEERQKILEQATQLQDSVLSRLEAQFQRQLQGGADPRSARRRYLNTARLAIFGVRTEQELRELNARRRRVEATIRTISRLVDALEDDVALAIDKFGATYQARAVADSSRARRQQLEHRLQRLRSRGNRLGPLPGRDDFDHFRQLQQDSEDAVQQILDQQAQDAESRLAEAISLYQAQQRNASARALVGASQGARLQRAVSDAQAFLGFLQSKGADKLQILDASTAVFEAQDALAQYVREQAQALVHAQAELAASRTYDPVKVALIRLKEAQQLLQYAQTPAEKIQGLAEVNNRKRELAGTRVQERVDQQQFLFDLGKLTREQYAAWIQRFLKAHGELRRVNREMFRQLRRTLHQLRTETEDNLDLEVGDIRLPTLYDVRRLILSGTRAGSPTVVNQTNSYNVHGVTDPEGVASAIGDQQRTSGRAAMRAAGLT